jgi:hypothetical protein
MSGLSGIIGDGESFVRAVFGDAPKPADAPVPAIHGGPPGRVEPERWIAPDASSGGQITVHRDVLNQVARTMHGDVAGLDQMLGKVKGASGGLGSLTRWSTGTGFHVNATNACHGFATVGGRTADMLTSAAKNLTDSASAYDEAETTSQQAIRGVSGQLDASGGSVSSANQVLG